MAINQLNEIHRANYSRAKSITGRHWTIPIVDNVIGLGKSEFSRHYILKSQNSGKTKLRMDLQMSSKKLFVIVIRFISPLVTKL